MNEASLVGAAKSTGTLDALYRAHADKLFCTIRRVTRNHEDAEDAVQDAFLSAFLHLQSFDGRSTFSTWLTRIGVNAALMILRKRRNSREVSVHSDGENDTAWEVPDSAIARPFGRKNGIGDGHLRFGGQGASVPRQGCAAQIESSARDQCSLLAPTVFESAESIAAICHEECTYRFHFRKRDDIPRSQDDKWKSCFTRWAVQSQTVNATLRALEGIWRC